MACHRASLGPAILIASGNDTEVILTLPPGSRTSQLAHIHVGKCPFPPGTVKISLDNVVDGVSTTKVNYSLENLRSGAFGINTHDVASSASFSCGIIERSTKGSVGVAGSQAHKGDTNGLWALGIISIVLSIVAVSGLAFFLGRRSGQSGTD